MGKFFQRVNENSETRYDKTSYGLRQWLFQQFTK